MHFSHHIAGMPRESRRLFRELLTLAPIAKENLIAGVTEHLARLLDQKEEYPQADYDTAKLVAKVLLELAQDYENYPFACQVALSAATHYFVVDNDGIPDLSSPTGFDDDAQVVLAVKEFISHQLTKGQTSPCQEQ